MIKWLLLAVMCGFVAASFAAPEKPTATCVLPEVVDAVCTYVDDYARTLRCVDRNRKLYTFVVGAPL